LIVAGDLFFSFFNCNGAAEDFVYGFVHISKPTTANSMEDAIAILETGFGSQHTAMR